MKKKVYLIGNAHIDPVWQWRWQDGLSEIKATFRSVLDRMKEYPELKFNCAGAMYYEWIEKSDPKMFEEIKARIQEGRWQIVGGWYLQPDCNMPSGEALARHGLISQRYFQEKFGVMAKTGYNVDSFGHSGGLPQILKKSGMDKYVFMRPQEHEKTLSKRLFVWRGQDGSEVTCYRLPYKYCHTDVAGIRYSERLAEEEQLDEMCFYGVGNHGGGPTMQLLDSMREAFDGDERYVHATVEEYFSLVDQTDIPTVTGDMQMHAIGAYSAVSDIKKKNRASENNLIEAEIASILSERLTGAPYPAAELKKGWKNVLFNQFHDILSGCITKPAVEDAMNVYGETLNITEEKINFAHQQISWGIDTLKGESEKVFRENSFFPFTHEKLGAPVVIFNPLPHKAKCAVAIFPKSSRVEDEAGNAVPFQIVRGAQTSGPENRFNTLIYTEVPAYGYKTVRIFRQGENKEEESPFKVGQNYLENGFVRLEFDLKSGGISRFYDKKREVELLNGTTENAIYDDSIYDTWAHNAKKFDRRLGAYGETKAEVLENGAVRATMRITTKYEGYLLQQDYTLYSDDGIVRVKARTNGMPRHRQLHIEFPVNVDKPQVYSEIQYGVLEVEANGNERPCGKWFAVTDENGLGISVLNKGLYSYGVDGKIAHITALRTAIYCDHYGKDYIDGFCEYMDEEQKTFEYALAPYAGKADAERKSLELNHEFRAVLETFHKGSLPTEYEGVSVDTENIILTAFKKAEDGKGYIVRGYESAGRETEVKISLALMKAEIKAKFSPYEVKTFRVENGKVAETNLIEFLI